MIEDREAVEAIDSIVSVPGLDLVLEGAIHLSQSYGVPARFDHPEVQQAIRRIAEACRRHRVPFCAIPRLPGQAEAWSRDEPRHCCSAMTGVWRSGRSRRMCPPCARSSPGGRAVRPRHEAPPVPLPGAPLRGPHGGGAAGGDGPHGLGARLRRGTGPASPAGEIHVVRWERRVPVSRVLESVAASQGEPRRASSACCSGRMPRWWRGWMSRLSQGVRGPVFGRGAGRANRGGQPGGHPARAGTSRCCPERRGRRWWGLAAACSSCWGSAGWCCGGPAAASWPWASRCAGPCSGAGRTTTCTSSAHLLARLPAARRAHGCVTRLSRALRADAAVGHPRPSPERAARARSRDGYAAPQRHAVGRSRPGIPGARTTRIDLPTSPGAALRVRKRFPENPIPWA